MLDHALALAARGFHVFPCEVGGKLPTLKDWPNRATRDEAQIRKWWTRAEFNVGIATGKFADDRALIVVDVDMKNGKNGEASLLGLEMQGHDLPPSMEQSTPSGGRHIIYVADHAARQGVDTIGQGLDIRSRGGFIVGPGSQIDGKPYRQINGHAELAPAPGWLVERLGTAPDRPAAAGEVLPGIDADRAQQRVIEYLKTAPTGGDPEAYPVACKLKDFGVSEADAVRLLQEHWDPRCNPPRTDDTATTVRNAYRYGKEPAGSAAPEAIFDKAEAPAADEGRHPAAVLNDEYAFIKKGAFVLQETTDPKGRFTTIRLPPPDMHSWFANKRLAIGDKQLPLSKVWMESAERREFDAVVFAPGLPGGGRFYNLWRGFTVQPKAGPHPSVDAFLEHALVNVCGGDVALNRWLIGFFAHMVQRPGEKPLVALVFRGAKGTGKNALVERVGALLGQHFLVADDERYLLSNFNGHLESNLFFVLDEASWAGDKRAEGKLKGLITGSQHNIERKGYESYGVDNLTRVAIIGNERWLVPATFDERRFAVFTVGDGRRQDRKFFHDMRVGMEQGGYAHLLHYLLHFDLKGVDVNDAPATAGLLDQKHASLEPVEEWWLDCIEADQLLGSSFDGAIPPRVPTNRMQEAFTAWSRGRNIRSRLPDHRDFMRQLRGVAPSLEYRKARRGEAGDSSYAMFNPGIAALRADWDRHIGGSHKWDVS